jgi:hypothetical protein
MQASIYDLDHKVNIYRDIYIERERERIYIYHGGLPPADLVEVRIHPPLNDVGAVQIRLAMPHAHQLRDLLALRR